MPALRDVPIDVTARLAITTPRLVGSHGIVQWTVTYHARCQPSVLGLGYGLAAAACGMSSRRSAPANGVLTHEWTNAQGVRAIRLRVAFITTIEWAVAPRRTRATAKAPALPPGNEGAGAALRSRDLKLSARTLTPALHSIDSLAVNTQTRDCWTGYPLTWGSRREVRYQGRLRSQRTGRSLENNRPIPEPRTTRFERVFSARSSARVSPHAERPVLPSAGYPETSLDQ